MFFRHSISKIKNLNFRCLHLSPLHQLQKSRNPVLSPFGKYELPLRFPEYNTVDVVTLTRQKDYATIFDVSQMSVLELSWHDKKLDDVDNYLPELLEGIFPINHRVLKENKSVLSVVLNEECVVQDDFIIGNVDNQKYRFVVNANTADDFYSRVSQKIINKKFKLGDLSNIQFDKLERIILSIQGDKSSELVEFLLGIDVSNLYFMENRTIGNDQENIEICRCGYTGEDGFEIYLDYITGFKIYQKILDLSEKDKRFMLGGLLERDILRLEAGLCLSGSEFGSELDIHFQDLDMNFLIGKKRKQDLNFIGGDNFNQVSKKVRSGFICKRPLRPSPIYCEDREVGFITSGVKSYNLDQFIGMGYVERDLEGDLYIKNGKKDTIILKCELPFTKTNYYRK